MVVLPSLILAPLWVVVVSGDAGAWRLFQNTDMPPEHFSFAWKLSFMLEHPLHFPKAVITSLRWSRDYWLQLIGILGWLETWLQYWVYPVVTVALFWPVREHAFLAYDDPGCVNDPHVTNGLTLSGIE